MSSIIRISSSYSTLLRTTLRVKIQPNAPLRYMSKPTHYLPNYALFQITYKCVLCLPALTSFEIPCHPAGAVFTAASERKSCTSVIFARILELDFGCRYRKSPPAPLAKSSKARSAIDWIAIWKDVAAELGSVVRSGTSHTYLRGRKCRG